VKIGEVVQGSVLGGLEVKLQLDNPEELRIGYPVIVEGKTYDFYCLVEDIVNQQLDIAERLAGSDFRDAIMPGPSTHEGYGGPIFYSKALLRPIQLIKKETGDLSHPQTIPPYFAEARHAEHADVRLIYEITDTSVPIGTIIGVEPYYVHIDFKTLTEKPFGIFGRTGAGKSILNKLICLSILAKDVGSVLIFDMQGEYGVFSRADKSAGLQYYFKDKVEVFSLDPKNKEAKPFIIDPREIEPDDLLVALQDLSPGMVDTIYAIDKHRGGKDLVAAIQEATVEQLGEDLVHEMSLNALKRRIQRITRLPFLREGKDAFSQMVQHVRQGKSIVLDFGDFGGDTAVYLFVANVLAHRLYDQWTEKGEQRRLIVFLEEAHKFLDPNVAPYTRFAQLARETRKFNLILALVDQRPTRIDQEVRSQLANRFVLSLKEQSDIQGALAGVQDVGMWEKIVGTIPVRTVAVIGDAIRVPTVIDIMTYDDANVHEHIVGRSRMNEMELEKLAEKADKIFGSAP
jgi:hypothetical protein